MEAGPISRMLPKRVSRSPLFAKLGRIGGVGETDVSAIAPPAPNHLDRIQEITQ